MLLELTDVDFAFRRGRPVLQSISALFPAGRVTAVVGPNGAGKTTLLRLMLGVLAPSQGRVLIRLDNGASDVARVAPRRRAQHLAYIPQQPVAGDAFTVEQIVHLGRLSRAADTRAVDHAIDALSLGPLRSELFEKLSAGQQQRVALARAVAQLAGDDVPPRLQAILADEPCSAMDPSHMVRAMQLLKQEAAHRAVVIILHDLTAALRFADDAIVLHNDGRVAFHGPVSDALTPERLENVYEVGFRRFVDVSNPADAAIVPAPLAPQLPLIPPATLGSRL